MTSWTSTSRVGVEPVSRTGTTLVRPSSTVTCSTWSLSSGQSMRLGQTPHAMLAWSQTEGAGFLGGAPLEWLTEDGNWAGKAPQGTDVSEWREVMLQTSTAWPVTAPDMAQALGVQGLKHAVGCICTACHACVQWSSVGLLEPWMLHTLQNTFQTLSTLLGVRIVALPTFKPWLEARGGNFPERLDGETRDELLLRLRRIQRLLLEEAPSQLVAGRCDAVLGLLYRELTAFSGLQTVYFRAELEELLFEVRRVATASEYKKFMRGFFFTLARAGLARRMVGTAFSTLQGMSEARVRERLRRGDFPIPVAMPVVRASVRHFKRTFQQPLQDVVDGQRPDVTSKCCRFCS